MTNYFLRLMHSSRPSASRTRLNVSIVGIHCPASQFRVTYDPTPALRSISYHGTPRRSFSFRITANSRSAVLYFLLVLMHIFSFPRPARASGGGHTFLVWLVGLLWRQRWSCRCASGKCGTMCVCWLSVRCPFARRLSYGKLHPTTRHKPYFRDYYPPEVGGGRWN